MKETRYLKINTEDNYLYFSVSQGSNSRKWMKRYRQMMDKYETLKNAPKFEGKVDYMAGFQECLDTFHDLDNLVTKEQQ